MEPLQETNLVEKELAETEVEIRRLSNAIATGGQLSGLLEAIQDREQRRRELSVKLAGMQALQQPIHLDDKEIRQRVRSSLRDRKGLLARHTSNARNILRKLLDGPIVCTPITDHGRRGLEFRAQVSLGPMSR